jgi:hypothetical protein
MYQYLINQDDSPTKKICMEVKDPTKNLKFSLVPPTLCYLTNNNLAKRNESKSQKCCFCDCSEAIRHLFFLLSTCQDKLDSCYIATRLYDLYFRTERVCLKKFVNRHKKEL